MRYLLMSTTDVKDENGDWVTEVQTEDFGKDFELLMRRYTLFCGSGRRSVLAVDLENQKIICQYLKEGHSVFNRFLMDV